MNRTWLILDCNYLCHRAKHATGNLSYNSAATGVAYGFLREVLRLMDEFQTQYIVFCWDYGLGKRIHMYKEYKQQRRAKKEEFTPAEEQFEIEFQKQMTMLRTKYLPAIGFRNIFYQQGYESDDIIAMVCKEVEYKNDKGIIISSDKDLYQLLRGGFRSVHMHNPQTRKTMTADRFKKEYRIAPSVWAMIKAIAGCSTDNVKGVTGVGEITAIKYVKNELKKESKAFQNIAQAQSGGLIRRNLKLVRLPLDGTEPIRLKKDRLSRKGWSKVTTKLGFKSIKDRFPMPKGLKK